VGRAVEKGIAKGDLNGRIFRTFADFNGMTRARSDIHGDKRINYISRSAILRHLTFRYKRDLHFVYVFRYII